MIAEEKIIPANNPTFIHLSQEAWVLKFGATDLVPSWFMGGKTKLQGSMSRSNQIFSSLDGKIYLVKLATGLWARKRANGAVHFLDSTAKTRWRDFAQLLLSCHASIDSCERVLLFCLILDERYN